MTQTALILGASGKIGRHSAQSFAAAGWHIRRFNRATDTLMQAARGVDVIVNGFNPPNYHNWAELIPQYTAQIIDAAQAHDATVVLPGNVYHFGDQPGIWSETTPPNPVSRKGRIRLQMEQSYRDSGVQTIVLRAGNFIDPEQGDDVFSLIYLRHITKGKIMLPGPEDVRQAACYLPDWARAAAELAGLRSSLAAFEDIPFPGHTLSGEDLKVHLEQILQRPLRFESFPWWALTLTAPFWELARELMEMRYLWHTDHALSAKRFNSLLPGFKPTPIETVLRTCL